MRHRNYRPRARKERFNRRDRAQDTQFWVERSDPLYLCSTTDIFDCAEEHVRAVIRRYPKKLNPDSYVDSLKRKFDESNLPLDGLIALLAQAPRTVLAQLQMDKNPRGYRDKQKRLYELIDFNDTFDSVILILSDSDRRRFTTTAKQTLDRTCKRAGVPAFSNDQWSAIVRGLSREIAIYLAAQENGFEVVMAPRSQDAIGIDIQVKDPGSGRYVNLDVKAPQSFRRRLEQLLIEGRINEKELLAADDRGYAVTTNGKGVNKTQVVTLSTLPERLGEISNFVFEDTAVIREVLVRLIDQHGLRDGKFGKITS